MAGRQCYKNQGKLVPGACCSGPYFVLVDGGSEGCEEEGFDWCLRHKRKASCKPQAVAYSNLWSVNPTLLEFSRGQREMSAEEPGRPADKLRNIWLKPTKNP